MYTYVYFYLITQAFYRTQVFYVFLAFLYKCKYWTSKSPLIAALNLTRKYTIIILNLENEIAMTKWFVI